MRFVINTLHNKAKEITIFFPVVNVAYAFITRYIYTKYRLQWAG